MKKIITVALLAAFFSVPAFAADSGSIYAGVKLGPSNVTGSPLGFGVYGGYNIDPNVTSRLTTKVTFAGEAEYTDLGSDNELFYTDKVSAIGAVVAATYPINSQFSVIGKAGLAITTDKITNNIYPVFDTTHTIGLRAGAAAEYNLTPQVGLRAGLDVYPNGYSMVSAGAVFKF